MCFALGMARIRKITQRGLGTDEANEVERIDAWWNPPPSSMTCPPSVPPPASQTVARRHQTISLEEDDG
jgi:hypothetical protein